MERRLTIHGYADGAPANTRAAAIAMPMRGGPIIETWDDMAARRVDLSRVTHGGNRGDRGGTAPSERGPTGCCGMLTACPVRHTPTITYKSAHFHETFGTDLLAVGPHTGILPIQCRGRQPSAAVAAPCQRRDRRDRGPHARSGLPGRASGPGPAGEPCAARNRGRRAARPTLRRRLSC